MGPAACCERKCVRIAGLAAILAAGMALVTPVMPASAQSTSDDIDFTTDPEAKLLLTAQQLVFDEDTETVTAIGAVQVEYDGFNMVTHRLVYDQRTGRLKAFGDIEMIEPDGNRIYAQELDVTDDFGDGFINALRIERPDDTRIVADSAQRDGGERTTFNNGVYTACRVCEKNPAKAPLWQVKARRVVRDGTTRTIRLERARFELFGLPIAWAPFLTMPDHTVKRKTGFLIPSITYANKLGAGLRVPYYFALDPHYDLTVAATGYTRQGVLLDAEFRQQLASGQYNLRVAGIRQTSPEAFSPGTVDANNTNRGLIASKGDFKINPMWAFGWDGMLQSDNSFANTYNITGYSGVTQVSNAYLTGLHGRNFFDLRAFYFDVQSTNPDSLAEKQQPIIHPSLDYTRTFDRPVAGGELTLDMNLLSLTRREAESDLAADRFRGIEGGNSRLTTELEWERTFVTSNGLLLTPLLAARGDVNALDLTEPTGFTGTLRTDGTVTRGMVTAGLEARYPVQVTVAGSSHILEPIGQIYARPDEQLAGELPNEDAQSFVFDASTLFERDKFSGYDRIEGGTRANVGVRYTGTFENGISLRSVFGQSYQIAGLNSFATDDLVNVGAASGLESSRSDYVGSIGVDLPTGFSLTAEGRFDESSFTLQRSDLGVTYRQSRFTASVAHTTVKPQPEYGSDTDRNEIKGSASINFGESWRAFGSLAYDIEESLLADNTIGFGYRDECIDISFFYKQTRDTNQAVDWSFGVMLNLRTLGDFNFGSSDLSDFTDDV